LDIDGPARRIIPKNLLKSASDATLVNLRETMLKSAALMTFFNEYDKDFLVEVVAEKIARVLPMAMLKEASIEPDVQFVSKDSNGYFYNGEEITAKVAGELLSKFGLDMEKRAEFMLDGGIVCIDERPVSKLANVVGLASPSVHDDAASESAYVGTVVDGYNVPHQVVAVRINDTQDDPTAFKPHVNTDHFKSEYGANTWLIVGKHFYAVQPDFNLVDYTPLTPESAKAAFKPLIPAIGLHGTAYEYGFSTPFTIAGVRKEFNVYHLFDIMGKEHTLSGDSAFYELPDKRVTLPTGDGMSFVPQYGENYTVATDGYGHFVLKDRELSYTNCIFRLMTDIGMSLGEAKDFADQAKEFGKVKFAADKKKEAPPTKEQKGAEKEQNKLMQQEAQQGQVTSQQSFEQQQQQQAQQQMMMQTSMQAVSFDDMQDVAKMSDPTLMDAYLSGKLADINVMGREDMMRVSDNLLNAIKSVSKLLFLIRQGKVDYINETDTAMALSKMGDIIRSIGLSVNQVS
jgi:hypothetical protein